MVGAVRDLHAADIGSVVVRSDVKGRALALGRADEVCRVAVLWEVPAVEEVGGGCGSVRYLGLCLGRCFLVWVGDESRGGLSDGRWFAVLIYHIGL